jgi:hypothetical protein
MFFPLQALKITDDPVILLRTPPIVVTKVLDWQHTGARGNRID